jgi:hypothetical protein
MPLLRQRQQQACSSRPAAAGLQQQRAEACVLVRHSLQAAGQLCRIYEKPALQTAPNSQVIQMNAVMHAASCRGEVQPSSWTTAEQLRLNCPPHKAPNNQRLRLACQVGAVTRHST